VALTDEPAGAPADGEIVADLLWWHGATAIAERADGDVLVLEAGFVNDETAREAAARVGERFPGLEIAVLDAEPALGAALDAWRVHARPVRVGGVHVRYPWLAADDDPPTGGEVVVVLDPSRAFGSGSHPSTRACLRAVARLAGPGASVLDVGCGSGVLAVTACRLGAARADGIDISPASVGVMTENARANGVESRVSVSTSPLSAVDGPYDIVVANLLAPTLIELADELRRVLAPDGVLVISGILAERQDHVLGALAPLRVIGEEHREGWAAVSLRW
jgi:ribosomal protein L11 methyltransferase